MVAENDKINKHDLFELNQICQWYSVSIYNHMHIRLAQASSYILDQLRIKTVKKALCNVPKNGYRFKLNKAELNIIYYLRNDCLITITAEQENSLVKFLKQQ